MENIMNIAMVIILVTGIALSQENNLDFVPKRRFVKATGLQCRNYATLQKLTRIGCSAKCVRLHQDGFDTCLGFQSEGTSCTLCLVCSESGRTTNPNTWTPGTGDVFAIRPLNDNQAFQQEIQKGKPQQTLRPLRW